MGPDHPALVSVGVRPTFHDEGTVLVEAYLLDFEGDLYGQWVTLEFLHRIRGDEKFAGVEALVAQITRDVARARELLQA